MKKIIAALLIATLPLAACHDNSKPSKFTRKTEKVYHFADGRYGYQDPNTGLWFYLMMTTAMNSGGSTTYSSPTYVTAPPSGSVSPAPSGGMGWSKGPAPSPEAVKEAAVEEMEVAVDAEGNPITPEEAVEGEAPAGEEATTTESEGTSGEATTGESGSSSTDSGSSSSDAGSGGGDSGGGGGDGGGGGGGE